MIIIQEFNPKTQCWNVTQRINENDYDADTFVPVKKYGGDVRILFPEKKVDFSIKDVVEEVVFEEEPEYEEPEFDEDRW